MQIPASYFQKEAQHMASVRGTSGTLRESLKPLQYGQLDPGEGYPIKEKINHIYAILIFIYI